LNTLPKRRKVLGILLIFLLLGSLVLGAAAEVAPKYISLFLLIVFLVAVAFGIVFYYNSKRKRRAGGAFHQRILFHHFVILQTTSASLRCCFSRQVAVQVKDFY
jgi:predicted membrane channel-forming protein YqfA (hemolysin III family)